MGHELKGERMDIRRLIRRNVLAAALAGGLVLAPAAGNEADPYEGPPEFGEVTQAEAQLKLDVENALLNHADAEVRTLRVNVDGDVVTLLGAVRTNQQLEEATEAAEKVDGVAEVINDTLDVDPDLEAPGRDEEPTSGATTDE